MELLKINNLSVWYIKDKLVLDGLNLELSSGCILGLLGKNGEGKTTLLNTLVGLHEQYTGEIFIDGVDISSKKSFDLKRKRFFIPDHPVLFDEMTPVSFTKFIHKVYGKEFSYEDFKHYSSIFLFDNYNNVKISTLSLGNRQKTILIVGFMIRCPLMILDEPLVGLDIMAVEAFYKLIREYVKEGCSVLFSTHLIDIAENLCDKIAILKNGSISKIIEIDGNSKLRDQFHKVMENE